MSNRTLKILILGYGNPGRLDDGLGPMLASKLEADCVEGVSIESNYQLTVEDAVDIAKHDIVIFADAALNSPEPFFFKKLFPQSQVTFTTHSISPESVLSLAHNCFGAKTEAYLLGIRGYEFNEFKEQISPKAQYNLEQAHQFVKELIQHQNFEASQKKFPQV
ncbi:MAG: hydrogenase maturation protease [SAR324 cluster bacterium]|nr:hydrogenase maturation protease [SAR324 cluster bacterium]